MTNNLKTFFADMFPSIILNNSIVSTIIFNLGEIFSNFQDRINKELNTDI